MYSVQSESHAPKTKPPKGKFTHTYSPTYNLSRFRAFLQSDVKHATEDPSKASSFLPSTSLAASTVDALIIPLALTSTNTLPAYSLTREAVMKLRLARAWTCIRETKVAPNMAHVRTIFYGTATVRKLIPPLHPDKRTSTLTTELNYKIAFNFLTEIALKAFNTNDNIAPCRSGLNDFYKHHITYPVGPARRPVRKKLYALSSSFLFNTRTCERFMR